MVDFAGGGAKPVWKVLDNFLAIARGSVATLSFPEITFEDDSMIVLVIDIETTLVNNLTLKINNDAASFYSYDGRFIKNNAETLIDVNTNGLFTFCSVNTLAVAGDKAFCVLHIGMSKDGTNIRTLIESRCAGSNFTNEQLTCIFAKDLTGISSLRITAANNDWEIGTRMTAYKVRR